MEKRIGSIKVIPLRKAAVAREVENLAVMGDCHLAVTTALHGPIRERDSFVSPSKFPSVLSSFGLPAIHDPSNFVVLFHPVVSGIVLLPRTVRAFRVNSRCGQGAMAVIGVGREGGIVILIAPIDDSRDLELDGAGFGPRPAPFRWMPREGWIWRLRGWEQG